MTNKELLENIIIDCEYLGKDKATIDIETIRSVLKDLETLEEIEKLYNIYNTTDTSEQIIIGNIFAILEERLENDK